MTHPDKLQFHGSSKKIAFAHKTLRATRAVTIWNKLVLICWISINIINYISNDPNILSLGTLWNFIKGKSFSLISVQKHLLPPFRLLCLLNGIDQLCEIFNEIEILCTFYLGNLMHKLYHIWSMESCMGNWFHFLMERMNSRRKKNLTNWKISLCLALFPFFLRSFYNKLLGIPPLVPFSKSYFFFHIPCLVSQANQHESELLEHTSSSNLVLFW